MGIKVGELFVNLGIKGSEKTIGAITQTTKGMGGLASVSLEAKAAILAAMYGLERMMSSSASLGTHLVNLSTLLGGPGIMKALQQYDYAAQQVGVSNQAVEGSFKSLQSVMTNIDLNKGAPEWAAVVGGKVGIDFNRKNDLPYMMQKLQQFAQLKNVSEAWKRQMLASFGLSDDVISAMEQNAFRPEMLARAPIYGDTEAKTLQHIKAIWANLEQKIEMGFGRFNTKHGAQLAKDIDHIVTSFLNLASAMDSLATKVHLFQGIANLTQKAAGATELSASGVKSITDAYQNPGDRIPLAKDALEKMGSLWWSFTRARVTVPFSIAQSLYEGVRSTVQSDSSAAQNNHVTVNQNFQHDGKDHQKHRDASKKGIVDAYTALHAHVRGS